MNQALEIETVVIKLKDGGLPEAETRRLAEAARACKVVAFPTDTVYGMGSNGLVKAAARKIYQIKGRPSTRPLPVLVSSVQEAKRWAQWTPAAEVLARKFWPGALTMVSKPTEEGKLLIFAEYKTVAIRLPGPEWLRTLIAASQVPWVSTSANLSGEAALSEGSEVVRLLSGKANYVIDGGKTAGRESTVVDASGSPVRVLRGGWHFPGTNF